MRILLSIWLRVLLLACVRLLLLATDVLASIRVSNVYNSYSCLQPVITIAPSFIHMYTCTGTQHGRLIGISDKLKDPLTFIISNNSHRFIMSIFEIVYVCIYIYILSPKRRVMRTWTLLVHGSRRNNILQSNVTVNVILCTLTLLLIMYCTYLHQRDHIELFWLITI